MSHDAGLERAIEDHCDAGRWDEATTVAIEGYGAELMGYLAALCGDSQRAGEVFSDVCFDLWRGMKGFRWESSFRTWAYRLAHNARARSFRGAAQRPERNVPLSDAPQVLQVVARVRTATAKHLRTELKTEIAKLREALSEDERAVLVLRVDRQLSWREIAEVLADDGEDLGRFATTLRKRFERAKSRLRALAEARGLL
jgi:RNA polymerase sigma-70 factor (ECF subfamily)